MKKSFFFVAALALVFAACDNNNSEPVYGFEAGFEETVLNPQSVFNYTEDGNYKLRSGNFWIDQSVSTQYGLYVAGGVISNITSTDFEAGNFALTNTCKSIAGGARTGQNYIVWYEDNSGNSIKLNEAGVVPGMYVTNNVYAYNSMKEGDDYAGPPFAEGDYFTLTITGSLIGIPGTQSVDVYLAQGTDILTTWKYVDLSVLGEVDELKFSFDGSRTGDWGVNTPTYVCIDDLGAEAAGGESDRLGDRRRLCLSDPVLSHGHYERGAVHHQHLFHHPPAALQAADADAAEQAGQRLSQGLSGALLRGHPPLFPRL